MQLFQLLVMQDVAVLLEMNSKLLQSSSLTAEETLKSVKQIDSRLKEMRTNKDFRSKFYRRLDGIMPVTEEEEEAPAPKRKRSEPKRNADYAMHSRAETA